MDIKKLRFRTGIFAVIMVIIAVVFAVELFRLQIVHGDEYVLSGSTYTQVRAVEAARGAILDRYGRVLVSNRTGYNIGINSDILFNTGKTNENILLLLETAESLGYEHTDTLPINETGSEYTFSDKTTTTSESYFRKFLEYQGWDTDITASNIYALLRDKYGIDENLSNSEVRDLIGVRYELSLRYAVGMDAYIFVDDVSSDHLSTFKELGVAGVEINTVTYREYHTKYAAHLLGYIGPIYAEEADHYKELGYSMNSYVGKDGVEQAFEEYLHGENGSKTVTIDEDGNIIDEVINEAAQPGSNVYLTIDIDMQEVAERSLENCILNLRSQDEDESGSDARGGSVVVMDIDSFDILACVSYPTYDIETFNQNFTELSQDEYSPLLNRALQAAYAPGSTYKMVTAAAAIDYGVISPDETIECTGVYRRWDDYQPVCNYFTNTGMVHGNLDVMHAIAMSCNIYFYEVGYRVGLRAQMDTAASFGLGQSTGVELGETVGTLAGDESRYEWYAADSASGAIGQSGNAFTPLQMCTYACTLANGGTRYNASLLSRVVSSDYKFEYETAAKTVLSTAKMSSTAHTAIIEGMKLTSSEGTGATVFGNYDVEVCSKTGTVTHGGLGSDHASFLCFAPADDPQIAVFVYVENGGRGGTIGVVARDILDYYFSSDSSTQEYIKENTIVK